IAIPVLATLFASRDRTSVFVFGPLWVIALFALIATPFYFRFRESCAAYAVTNRRVLIWDRDPFLREKFLALDAAAVAQLSREGDADDAAVGSLILVPKLIYFRLLKWKLTRRIGILYIRGCPTLERRLREHLIDPYTDRMLS